MCPDSPEALPAESYKGVWANLKGTHFEGALLSSSDVVRVCENPTLDEYTAQAELGCRKSRGAR